MNVLEKYELKQIQVTKDRHERYKRLKDNLAKILTEYGIQYSIEQRHNGYIVFSQIPIHFSCAIHDVSIDTRISETVEVYSSTFKPDEDYYGNIVCITRLSIDNAARLIHYMVSHPNEHLTESEAYYIAFGYD